MAYLGFGEDFLRSMAAELETASAQCEGRRGIAARGASDPLLVAGFHTGRTHQ
jgi:hypothetical protein